MTTLNNTKILVLPSFHSSTHHLILVLRIIHSFVFYFFYPPCTQCASLCDLGATGRLVDYFYLRRALVNGGLSADEDMDRAHTPRAKKLF